MIPKPDYQLEREARYIAEGFTIIDDAKPEIGKPVEAVRVFQPRGFGGVILRTEYKIVPIIRETEYGYTDTLNGDRALAYSEFEAWREFKRMRPQLIKTRPNDVRQCFRQHGKSASHGDGSNY